MNQPICLFTPVHKGLRHALSRLSFQAGSLDMENDADVQAFEAEWKKVYALLEFHAENEDAFVQPFIDQLDSTVAGKLEKEHQASEDLLIDLNNRLTKLVSMDAAERKIHTFSFIQSLNQFLALYWNHMETEEKELMDTLRKLSGTEQLMDISLSMHKAVPPDVMLDFLFYMLPAMNMQERTQLLTGMKRSAPEAFFQKVISVAEQVLEKHDFTSLQTRLENVEIA
ncbi:hemerythrin domain-containing protein [Brevibacillus sp. SYSU BS000544]|uniref:hemerythrin domain-containing protein n=1 Tax=Brevibacillus sp. SYSU BS000544 TaxID=3416443 RepID=UPI003CE48769